MVTCALINLLMVIGIGSNPDKMDETKVKELIGQLGHSRFALREQAEKGLVQIGPLVLPWIREGLASKDNEVRRRCEKLLPILIQLDWTNRADEYVKGLKNEKKYEMPFRQLFERLMGKDLAAKKLFREVIKSSGSFLQEIEKDPKNGLKLYREQCPTTPNKGI